MKRDTRLFIYRLDPDDCIIHVNQHWLDFAQENGAPELTREAVLGQPVSRYIADWDTSHLYELIYEKVRSGGKPFTVPIRCDSPERRRYMMLQIAPAGGRELELTGRVLKIEERPPTRLPAAGAEGSKEFVVVICAWCKKIRANNSHWLEIEEALQTAKLLGPIPPSLTHGVCPDCRQRILSEL